MPFPDGSGLCFQARTGARGVTWTTQTFRLEAPTFAELVKMIRASDVGARYLFWTGILEDTAGHPVPAAPYVPPSRIHPADCQACSEDADPCAAHAEDWRYWQARALDAEAAAAQEIDPATQGVLDTLAAWFTGHPMPEDALAATPAVAAWVAAGCPGARKPR